MAKLDPVTPESTYLNRRTFLKGSILAGTTLTTASLYRHFRPARLASSAGAKVGEQTLTPFASVSGYNNYYEFSTDKENVADRAANFNPGPWSLAVGGLVEEPKSFSIAELKANWPGEERVYRLRCVEGWSMVIPWKGFALADLVRAVRPRAEAKYVSFTSYYDPRQMPDAIRSGLPFPYVEDLRIDEARHPLAFLATGLYGRDLPNQNGAPVRLVVPWKYGFKSAKALTKIEFVADRPATTWNLANAEEYGFYANVNPEVDHPRWSQAHERRIGESELRPTEKFNGYGEVASLYEGMDLKAEY